MARAYDNYSSLIDFTRASSGTALRPISYGDELVTNGTFDTDSGWVKQTGWTINGGVASFNGGGGSSLLQAIGMVTGIVYEITFDITSISSGGIRILCGFDNASQTFNSVGTHTAILTRGSNNFIYFQSVAATVASIDNVSVREVLFDQPNGTLTLFNHPTNIPRIEYDADGNRLGLLVEESRTNLVTYSEDFTQWSNTRSNDTANATVSPDGGTTATSFYTDNTASSSHIIKKSATITASSTNTFSVFLKANALNHVRVLLTDTAVDDFVSAFFDLSTGTVGTTDSNGLATFLSATIQNFGSGWYRCSITGIVSSDTAIETRIYLAEAGENVVIDGDGASGVYIWGAQLEAGSFPTSYIPTSGSTATRSADVASIGVSEFGYNQSAFTLLMEASHLYDTFPNFNRFWELAGGGDVIRLSGDAGSLSYAHLTIGGVQQIDFSSGAATVADANTFMKYAIGLKTNDFDIARDGSLDTGDTSITMPDAIDTLNIGAGTSGSIPLNGHIKSIKYYPRRLTDAQLQELTS